MLAAMARRDRGKAHRHIGRAEGRDAGFAHFAAFERREHGETVDVRGLALVGSHAERRVALQMLDRDVVLAHRERDVLGGDVVLQIDPDAAGVVARSGARARPTTAQTWHSCAAHRLQPRRPRPSPRQGAGPRSNVPLAAPHDRQARDLVARHERALGGVPRHACPWHAHRDAVPATSRRRRRRGRPRSSSRLQAERLPTTIAALDAPSPRRRGAHRRRAPRRRAAFNALTTLVRCCRCWWR